MFSNNSRLVMVALLVVGTTAKAAAPLVDAEMLAKFRKAAPPVKSEPEVLPMPRIVEEKPVAPPPRIVEEKPVAPAPREKKETPVLPMPRLVEEKPVAPAPRIVEEKKPVAPKVTPPTNPLGPGPWSIPSAPFKKQAKLSDENVERTANRVDRPDVLPIDRDLRDVLGLNKTAPPVAPAPRVVEEKKPFAPAPKVVEKKPAAPPVFQPSPLGPGPWSLGQPVVPAPKAPAPVLPPAVVVPKDRPGFVIPADDTLEKITGETSPYRQFEKIANLDLLRDPKAEEIRARVAALDPKLNRALLEGRNFELLASSLFKDAIESVFLSDAKDGNSDLVILFKDGSHFIVRALQFTPGEARDLKKDGTAEAKLADRLKNIRGPHTGFVSLSGEKFTKLAKPADALAMLSQFRIESAGSSGASGITGKPETFRSWSTYESKGRRAAESRPAAKTDDSKKTHDKR